MTGLLRDGGARIAIAMTRVYPRVKAVQPQTALERVVATNIKEYFPPGCALLFTLFKETKDGHRITLAARRRVVEAAAPNTRRARGRQRCV